jgi:hypothetical protein
MEKKNIKKRHLAFKEEKIEVEKALRLQERWRQKQLDIYFRYGRPIFKTDEHKVKFYSLF